MQGGSSSRSETKRDAASEELIRSKTAPGNSVRSTKTTQRGWQHRDRVTPKVSTGSTSNDNSPFKESAGVRLSNWEKCLTASGSSFTGVGNPHPCTPGP